MKWLYIDDKRIENDASIAAFLHISQEMPDESICYRKTVLYSDDCGIPEQIGQAVDQLCSYACQVQPDYIFINSPVNGPEYTGRLAVRLGMEAVTNAEKLTWNGQKLLATVPVYSGNLAWDRDLSGCRAVINLQSSAFEKEDYLNDDSQYDDSQYHDIFYESSKTDSVDLTSFIPDQKVLCGRIPFEENQDSLKDAEAVLILGHAFRRKEQVEEAVRFSEKAGLVLGGSRPVIIDGLLPVSRLVGMSGSSLHAKKCLLMGVSGAAAFLEGIKYCDRILAVNIDRDAGVFRASHQGICGDCHTILQELTRRMAGEEKG